MTKEELVVIAKLLARHSTLIESLAQAAADQACMLATLLPKCSHPHCSNLSTVTHKHLSEARLCDMCAARAIVQAGRNITADLNDPINILRGSLMREEDWEDLPHADKVRRLVTYVDIIEGGGTPIIH